MKMNLYLLLGVTCLHMLLAIAILGPYLPNIDEELKKEHLRKIGEGKDETYIRAPFPPSKSNPIGTDADGVDLLSRLIIGTKETLMLVVSITIVRSLLGLLLGVIAANYPYGRAHRILLAWNRFFYGLPAMFAILLILSLPIIALSPNRYIWFVLVIAMVEVGRVGDIYFKEITALTRLPYVESGVMIGNGPIGLLIRYYLPHILPSIIVNFVIELGKAMLLLGQLGFIKIFADQVIKQDDGRRFFIENNSNSWPAVLADSRRFLRNDFYLVFWPSAFIAYTVLTFNLLGEGLRRKFERRVIYNR
jgi:peptide/nickel transport system permease protein